MYRNHRVVAWIPYGRRKTVKVLVPYLLREQHIGVLDEVMLCMNLDPDQGSDKEYANYLVKEHSLFKQYERPRTISSVKQMNTGLFVEYMQDTNTLYIRLDDDIVWMHPKTVRTLCDKYLDGNYFVIFPMIWNNAVSTYWAQQCGAFPKDWGVAGNSAVDSIGWRDAVFGQRLHEYVLEALEAGDSEKLQFDQELELDHRFSVSCFVISGKEYAAVEGKIPINENTEEEAWHSITRAKELGKKNLLCPSAQVAHLTFYTQRAHILKNTNIASRYEELSKDMWESFLVYSARKGVEE